MLSPSANTCPYWVGPEGQSQTKGGYGEWGQSAVCQLSSLCPGDWLVCPLVTRGGVPWALRPLLPPACETFCLWFGLGVESPRDSCEGRIVLISKPQCVCSLGGPGQGLYHSGGTKNIVAHSGTALWCVACTQNALGLV